MTEQKSLGDQIFDYESPIIDLENGLAALRMAVQEIAERNEDNRTLYFVEVGLQAVYTDLRAKWEALNGAARREGLKVTN